jgi:hypothetical protein
VKNAVTATMRTTSSRIGSGAIGSDGGSVKIGAAGLSGTSIFTRLRSFDAAPGPWCRLAAVMGWRPRIGYLALGAVAMSLLLGPTARRVKAREATTEVALSGTQAFVHIPTFELGYEKSPAAIGQSILMTVLSPWWADRISHRVVAGMKTLTLIDSRGARQDLWSLDESWQSISPEEYGERFH